MRSPGVTRRTAKTRFASDPDPRPRAGSLCDCELESQNEAYAGTGGVSQNNRAAGFAPAYQNLATGEAVISRFADGRPSPVHVLDGLPDAWVTARDEQGHVRQTLATVIAGFMRGGVFYTRDDAARLVADETVAGAAAASDISPVSPPPRSR